MSQEGKARSAANALKHGILTEDVCARESAEQQRAFAALRHELLVDFQAFSTMEMLLVERLAAALWRGRRVLAFESGAALERDHAPTDSCADVLDQIAKGEPADPRALERGQSLARSLAPEGALDLVIRYEAHLTREISHLLKQLEQVRELVAIEQ